jgi:hypothetical protein
MFNHQRVLVYAVLLTPVNKYRRERLTNKGSGAKFWFMITSFKWNHRLEQLTLHTKLDLFKWKKYESAIIFITVSWYLKFSLSYRDIVEMLSERGLMISHKTIMRWVHEFRPEIDKRNVPF